MEDRDAITAWDKGKQGIFFFFAWLICLWLNLTLLLQDYQSISDWGAEDCSEGTEGTATEVNSCTFNCRFYLKLWSVRMRCLVAMVTRSLSTYCMHNIIIWKNGGRLSKASCRGMLSGGTSRGFHCETQWPHRVSCAVDPETQAEPEASGIA